MKIDISILDEIIPPVKVKMEKTYPFGKIFLANLGEINPKARYSAT